MASGAMRSLRLLAVALFTWCARVYRRYAGERTPVLHVVRGGRYGHVAAWRRRDTARRLHVLRLPVRPRDQLPGEGA